MRKIVLMKFLTEIPIKPLEEKISYDSKIVSVGSCFAVNMAEKFKQFQFQYAVNPFGILFHTQAIENLFQFALEDKLFTEEDIFLHNEIWSSFDAHSDLNELEADEVLFNLNSKIRTFRSDLESASHLILTLGTSWVYRNVTSEQLVANCHKIPQKEFTKEILSVNHIQANLKRIVEIANQINPNLKIIFTISPVRHIKDGFVENQLSKAHLIAALQGFLQENKEHYYFPAFEIMMDELRDYRFYAADLLHPNEMAINYIWERFMVNCISEESEKTMKLVDEVQKGLAHRPFNPYSENHNQFLEKLAQKLDVLLEQYPFMNFR